MNDAQASDGRRFAGNADVIVLIVLALLVALPLRGLFLKPNGDFYGIWETGEALIHGEWPASFKRAPAYPVLVAGLGEVFAAVGYDEVPAQRAAEWINTLLLPLNAVLVYWLGRCWAGGAGRWAAWWFILLPVGMYCTTHVLVEPLLITTVLATLIAAQRGSGWAYGWAGLAALTRYDVAGAIAGLLLADLLARRPARTVLVRGALATMPLAIWLILTAATWRTSSNDHYLAQIAEGPRFDVGWSLGITPRMTFDVNSLRLPYLLQGLDPYLRWAIHAGLFVLAVCGTVLGLRRQPRGMVVAVAVCVGYMLVHAIFPFQFDRFGYPLAPVYLLVAAIGGHEAASRWRFDGKLGRWGCVALAVLTAMLALTTLNEIEGCSFLTSPKYMWAMALPASILLGTAVLWGLTRWASGAALPRTVALLALATLALAHLRGAVPGISAGGEMDNLVAAARWVRSEVPTSQRVLSATPGLLRLYAGREPRARFLSFDEVMAENWPDILAECREREIAYVIWYDEIFSELGDYYIRKCRLERFARLSRPEQVEGVAVLRSWPDRPKMWILRVLPTAETGPA